MSRHALIKNLLRSVLWLTYYSIFRRVSFVCLSHSLTIAQMSSLLECEHGPADIFNLSYATHTMYDIGDMVLSTVYTRGKEKKLKKPKKNWVILQTVVEGQSSSPMISIVYVWRRTWKKIRIMASVTLLCLRCYPELWWLESTGITILLGSRILHQLKLFHYNRTYSTKKLMSKIGSIFSVIEYELP